MSTIHLEKLLNPKSIAVVGASDRDGSPGKAVVQSIISGGYAGPLSFVNPRYKTILGQESLKSISKLTEPPDLLIVLVPQKIIRKTLAQAAQLGVRVVLVMSSFSARSYR